MTMAAVNSIAVLLVTDPHVPCAKGPANFTTTTQFLGLRLQRNEQLGRMNVLNAKDEPVAADDLDAVSSCKGCLRARQPDFPLDPYSPLAALPGNGLALGADQCFAAGHYWLLAGA